jgi:hypothetical protein
MEASLPENAEKAVGIIKNSHVDPLMVMTNWGPHGFDPRTVLGDNTLKEKTINTLSGK